MINSTPYTRSEVYNKTLEYFNGDSLATDVWINKYALKDHEGNLYELTPDDMHRRIAKEFARIEDTYSSNEKLTEEDVYNLIKDFRFIIPQGSPMAGIGNDYQTTSLGNCFVVGNDSDSYGGILKTDQEMVHLMKRRGGVGVDISHIRPKGCAVNNAAIASTGVVPFMERYSNTTREVAQDGRRGALMISIDIKHPDVEDFIDAKLELKKVTGANISVKITNEFLNCVLDDTMFIQQFPIDSDTPIIRKEINAKKLWKKFIHNAWKSAEPGMFFWDTIISESPADCYSDQGFKTITTNPCLVGETKIALADGRKNISIKQLAEEGLDVPVYCISDNGELKIRTMRHPRITGYNQKILKVTIENGHTIRCTENHKFRLKNGSYCEAKDLKNGMSLEMLSKTFNKKDYIDLNYNNTSNREHRFIFEQVNNIKIEDDYIIHHIDYNTSNNHISNLQYLSKKDHDKLHSQDMIGKNNPYYKLTDEQKFNFASHKGNSNGRYINISNDEIIQNIINLTKKLGRRVSSNEWSKYAIENNLPITLSKYRQSDLGNFKKLASSICKNLNIMPEEYIHYDTRTLRCYNESINQGYNTKIINKKVMVEKKCEHCGTLFWTSFFNREVSFCSSLCSNHHKNKFTNYDDLKTQADNYNHKIISVEADGFADVYNGTVDEFHNFFFGEFEEIGKTGFKKLRYFNGLNCGEIPLSIADSCRLLCINLYSYVKDPFTKNAHFDFALFEYHVRIAQKLMDDIVDLESEKIQTIIQKVLKDPESQEIKQIELDLWRKIQVTLETGRRTGLGITAEADMLAALGFTYGTEQATSFAESVHKVLAINSFKSSVKMAKERGCFRIWDYNKEKHNPFLNRILDELELDEIDEYKQYGRRNISETTLAPTGSISILSQTSSGVEPVFMLYHTRRRKINPNDKSTKVDFIDELGDHWEEYNIVHPKFKDWAFVNGHANILNYSKHQIEDAIKQSPYYKATANEIDWVEKVKMIGAIQKWISHSISNTLNLPENVTEELVSEVFMNGWKYGCKGLTIYRDKSRSGVLVDLPENKINVFKENHAPKRPKNLPSDVIRFVNKGEKWIGFLGLLDNRPFEIFTGPADQVPIPVYITFGEIVKDKNENGNNLYNFKYIDKDGFVQEFKGLSRAFNREYWNTGKMISAILRHGMPIANVIQLIDSLDIEGKESLTNWVNGVKRMLKKYIQDGTKTKDLCPECKDRLIFISGCNQCQNCGYSKCS